MGGPGQDTGGETWKCMFVNQCAPVTCPRGIQDRVTRGLPSHKPVTYVDHYSEDRIRFVMTKHVGEHFGEKSVLETWRT